MKKSFVGADVNSTSSLRFSAIQMSRQILHFSMHLDTRCIYIMHFNAFQCILYVATGKVVDTSEEPPLAALGIQCCWYVRLLALVSDATF